MLGKYLVFDERQRVEMKVLLSSSWFAYFLFLQQKDGTPLKNCVELRDDYLECLHNRRVGHRKNIIKQEEKAQANGGHAHGHGGH
jgi:hypothetical protein